MSQLTFAALFFIGLHVGVAGTSARGHAIEKLGYNTYRAAFSLKEYRKRNVSGAVYDDPRVAVGAGRFDGVGARAEAESKCKAIRHGVKSFAQASGAQRTVGELCAAAVAGRTRAAEGITAT